MVSLINDYRTDLGNWVVVDDGQARVDSRQADDISVQYRNNAAVRFARHQADEAACY